MKLLIVRHGDPDYERDSLTEKGWKEVEYLSERLSQLDVKAFYVSPLGRAKDTASVTLKKMNRTAEECKWLQEFPCMILRPDKDGDRTICWDWLPEDWMAEERFFQYDRWFENSIMEEGKVKEEYDYVIRSFDALLEKHGYKRDGHLYRAVETNNDTIVLFCHFGLECVLLSHLLNTSPMIFWQGACAAPSSVTSLITEERREGTASFRMNYFGDISHLYANHEECSHAARFRESCKNPDRID